LLNAISLNFAQFHLARFLGPVIAALIISKTSISWCFYFNGISFLGVIFGLMLIKNEINKQVVSNNNNKKWHYEIFDGLRYVKNNKNIMILLITSGVMSFFGIGYMVLLPIYAKNIFHGGANILGTLMSSAGLGAFCGAIIVSGLNLHFTKKQIVNYAMIFFAWSLSIFAMSKIFYLSLGMIFLVGMMFVMTISSLNTLLQESVDETFRGRIMSNFVMIFNGSMAVGSLVVGFIAELLKPSLALISMSFVIFLWSVMLKYKFDWEKWS
jgi:predicted MFS family arabinose efflux permease